MRQRARNRKAINAHRGDSSASAGSHVERVRLLKSEGTKKENKENKKKCPRPTWDKFFTARIELWLATHR